MELNFKDLFKTKSDQFLKLGGQLVTKILKDTAKGISQDGKGTTADFPRYSTDYALKKLKGKFKSQKSKQVVPPNLKLTGQMLGSIRTQKATQESVEINFRQAGKFQGNADKGRNVVGLNDKNFNFAKEFFEKIIDTRLIKFSKKDIIIDINKK